MIHTIICQSVYWKRKQNVLQLSCQCRHPFPTVYIGATQTANGNFLRPSRRNGCSNRTSMECSVGAGNARRLGSVVSLELASP